MPQHSNNIAASMHALSLPSSTSSTPKEKNHTTLPPQAPQPSSRCQDAFQLPEILLRILQFVPLWIHPPHPPTFFDDENITFSPRNILSCSLVSKPWRNPSLDLLFFVHHSQHQRQIPKQLVLLQSHRYRVFVDSQDFWTREFRGLGNLVVLEVRCGLSEGQMREVLERSARLEELLWTRVGCSSGRGGGILKGECLEMMLRLSRLRVLVLEGWVVEWADLWALCRANPNLKTLGLGSTRRWESRAPFQDGDREMELLSVEDLKLKLVCPSHGEEEEDEDNEALDVVAFLPYLKRLRLDVFTRVDGKLLIANLHKARARARLAATVANRSNSSPALLLPLPSKLESLEIHIHQGTTLDPTDEDNQTPYLTFPEITTLIQEHAHPQGLTRFHLHLTTISPLLTSAIRAIPPSSPFGYNVLQDLEIRISDFYGHTSNPIPWIRSILATCTRLRRVYLDLVGPQAEQKVYMRFAQGLFCGEVEADEAEEGGSGGVGGVVDPRKAWACAGSLEELTVLGIQLPAVVDMAGYLGWRYRKSENGRLKKVWRTNRQRLQGLFTRARTSTSTSTSATNANNGNRNRNSNEGNDDTSSSEEEEQQCSRKDRRISMTRVIAFEIYENLKNIGRDPDTVCPDDVTYLDRLLSFACPDYSPSSSSSSSSSLDSQQQQLQQQQRTRKQYKQKQKQKQTPPYHPSRAEMRFNAQLATQIAQCPRLIMLRLNWDTYTQELTDLRARQKVLQLEQQEEELLREKIVVLKEGPSEKTTKVQQQQRQSQKQEQTQEQNKRRSFLFG